MRKFIVGMMASASLLAVPPVYAQDAPAASTAPGSGADECADNSYVPVYDIPDNGETDSLAAAGSGETNADARDQQAAATPTPAPTATSTPPRPRPSNGVVSVPGANRTIGGQPVVVKGPQVNTATMTPQMRSILDDIYAVARRMGMPTPVITSGSDSRHRTNSRHYSGNAIDLRCNGAYASASRCRAYATELARVIGGRYDVIFEVFPDNPANNHIHIEYDP